MASQVVKVYIYELTKGMARTMSAAFLGKQIEGVWHTGIVAYGQEFFYGGMGIESCEPGGTGIGAPDEIENLGTTEIPFEVFMDYLQDLSSSTFRGECYHLLDHNCNTFSDELAQFLTGKNIPAKIINLPQEVLTTPFGAMMKPFLDAMSANPGGGRPIAQQPAAVKPAQPTQQSSQQSSQQPASQTTAPESTNQIESSSKTQPSTPGISYREKEMVQSLYSKVSGQLKSCLDTRDMKLCDEMSEYITATDPDWGLSPSHISTIEKILIDTSVSVEVKEAVSGLLQESLLHPDIVLMLVHSAPHSYTNILQGFERQDTPVKEKILKGLCNCSSMSEGLTWLMPSDKTPLHQVSTDICNQSMLHGDTSVYTPGAVLAANLTRSQMKSDLAFDLGCALVELLRRDIDENTAKHGITSLCRCIDSNSEIAGLAAVSGVDSTSLAAKFPPLKSLCDGTLKHCMSKFQI